MELQQYIRILRKRWWLILLLTAVSTGSALYYNSRQPPIYRSTVTLLLSPARETDSLLPYLLSDRTSQLALTYARYLKTRAFAERVIDREGLNVSAAELVNAISAQVVEGTQFFEITATSNDASEAQQLAMAIANNFIAENLAQQQEQLTARRAASDVDNTQAVLREKLEREQAYFEGVVENLRLQVEQIQGQPASAARDELLADVQTRLSENEAHLVQIMSDRVDLQSKLDESQINTVSIVEPAPLPDRPINSQNTQNVLFALTAGLVLGITLAFGLEYLDYTVRTPAELEQLVGVPPLGVLSIAAGENSKIGDRPPVVMEQPRSPHAEAFRSLRTNLRYSQVGRQLRSLVITSAGPGEGKTTVAGNLAATLAHSGQKVILVDADLRRPRMHRLFSASNQLGLSNLIIAENPTHPDVLKQHLQSSPVENLRLLTSGPVPINPAELLGNQWTSDIFAALEADADVVIYDTPPALTVTDAVILASRADATLVVVHAGRTRRDIVLKTRAVLERVGAQVLAPVLNQVKAGDVGYYHYYYYSGRYGYTDTPESDKQRRNNPFTVTQTKPAASNGSGAKHQPVDSAYRLEE